MAEDHNRVSAGLWLRCPITLGAIGFCPPQIGAVSITLALITPMAERLQVVHGIATAVGAG